MDTVQYTPLWKKLAAGFFMVFIACAALAVLYTIFGRTNDPAEKAKLYLEICKAMLQLVGVLVLGTVASMLVKNIESGRKADKALNDFRSEFLDHLMTINEEIIRARFKLRSSGLTNEFGPGPFTSLTSTQLGSWDEALTLIQEAHISLLRQRSELESFPDAFTKHQALKSKLEVMSKVLKDLCEEYDKNRPSTQPQIAPLTCLLALTGRSSGSFNQLSYSDWTNNHTAAVVAIRGDLLPLKASVHVT